MLGEPIGTAIVTVDTSSGSAVVSALNAGGASRGTVGADAVFNGSAVSVTSAKLLDDSGEVTMRRLQITVRNNTPATIGGGQGLRLALGSLAPLATALTDVRGESVLGTVAGTGGAGMSDGTPGVVGDPYGVHAGADGSLYVVCRASGGVVRVKNGNVSTVVPAGTLNSPRGIVGDDEFLYVACAGSNNVKRVRLDGTNLANIAGSNAGASGDATGTSSLLNGPTALALDEFGTLYIADTGNNKIKRVDNPNFSPTSCQTVGVVPASVGALSYGMFAGSGRLVFATSVAAGQVGLMDPDTGAYTMISGTSGTGSTTGTASNVGFNTPLGLAVRDGCIIVGASGQFQLLLMRPYEGSNVHASSTWHVAQLAGSGVDGHTDGGGSTALTAPGVLCTGSNNSVYYSEPSKNYVRRLDVTTLSVISGIGNAPGSVSVANPDGYLGRLAQNAPYFLTHSPLAPGQELTLEPWDFVLSTSAKQFRFVLTVDGATAYSSVLGATQWPPSTAGSDSVLVRTLAGPNQINIIEGTLGTVATDAMFVCVAEDGTAYLASSALGSASLKVIRRVSVDGNVTVILGGAAGAADGTGLAASFTNIRGISCTADGNTLFISDGAAIRRATGSGPNPESWSVTTIAGSVATSGLVEGPGTTARFGTPSQVAVSDTGRQLWVADETNHSIRMVRLGSGSPSAAASWVVSTVAGSTGGVGGYVNAAGTSARFQNPRGICLAPDGNMYVSEDEGHRIRRINGANSVTLLAGSNVAPAVSGHVDASGASASFTKPADLAYHRSGYLYVADMSNHCIRRIHIATGEVRTVAGTVAGYVDGVGAAVKLTSPQGLALQGDGTLWCTDASTLRACDRIVSND